MNGYYYYYFLHVFNNGDTGGSLTCGFEGAVSWRLLSTGDWSGVEAAESAALVPSFLSASKNVK